MFRRFAAVLLLSFAAFAPAAEPTEEQIAQAIRDLGDRNFQVREKATKFLWQAGEAAELPLQRAAQGADPEVVRRAKSILERFDRGEHPDTPKDVVELLQQYRSGNQTTRLGSLNQLAEKGKHGFRALRRLSRNRDFAADRPLILGLLVRHAPRQVPRLIVAGDVPTAQEWLEYCLLAPGFTAHENNAALWYLRKELPRAIAFWKGEAPGPTRTLALAHLALVQGDWNSGRPFVEDAKDTSLRDRLNLAAGAWQRVSNVSAALESSKATPETQRLLLAAYKLGKESEKFEATLARLIENRGSVGTQTIAETLLQLGDWTSAERWLLLKHPGDPFLFELIAERRGDKAALEWAHQRKTTSDDEQRELDWHMARRLFLLGEKVEATKLAVANIGNPVQPSLFQRTARWVAMLQAVGQLELAVAHAAGMLEALRKNESDDGVAVLFQAIFGADAAVAEPWWYYLRVAVGGESAAKTMQIVRQILAGDKVPQMAEWARDVAGAWRTAVNEDLQQSPERRERALMGPIAAAVAIHRAGLDQQAETAFREGVQALPVAGSIHFADFLLSKRRFAEAAAVLDAAWQNAPDQPLLLFMRGHTLDLAGQKMEGTRLKELAHWLPLANLRSRRLFAEELTHRSFHADARREVEIALAVGNALDPNYDALLQAGAADAERRGDMAQAARRWTQALAHDLFIEAPPQARFSLGRNADRCRALAANMKADLLRDFGKALAQAPRSELVTAALPVAARLSALAEATAASKPALDLLDQRCKDFPKSAWACNEFAWLAAHLKQDLDLALNRAKQAVVAEPRNAAYLDTLAEVHFRRGEKEQALATNKECRDLHPRREYYQRQRERFEKADATSFPGRE